MVTVEVTATCEHCKDSEKSRIPISQLNNCWWKPKDWTWVSAEVGPPGGQQSLRSRVAVLVCPKCRKVIERGKHAGVSMGVRT